MENRFPAGLSSREAIAYALGLLATGTPAHQVINVLSSINCGVGVDLVREFQGCHVVVCVRSGVEVQEFTAAGPTAEGAIEIALTLAAFPPPLDKAVEDLLAALEAGEVTTTSAVSSDEAMRLDRDLQHARACARAALVRARSAT